VKSKITQEISDKLPPPQNTTVLFTATSSEEIIALQKQVLLQCKGYNVNIIEVVTPSSHKMWIRDTVKQNLQTFFNLSSNRISGMTKKYFELWEQLNKCHGMQIVAA
jgi:superfamily II DNA/RNA helicase